MKQLLFSIAFSVFTVVALAQNTVNHNQTGTNHASEIVQGGGDLNNATLNQAGNQQTAIILQSGNENNATIEQSVPIVEGGNDSEIIQTGDKNNATVTQSESRNVGIVLQEGSANEATINQQSNGIVRNEDNKCK